MFRLTMGVDDRIHELQTTAAELRYARNAAKDRRFGWPQALRLRVGMTFLALGDALVSGARPTAISRANR
jgi:hypothetical protein